MNIGILHVDGGTFARSEAELEEAAALTKSADSEA